MVRLRGRQPVLATSAALLLTVAFSACGGGAGESTDAVSSNCLPDPPTTIDDGFPEVPVRYSENGVLETTLRASYSPVTLDGEQYETMNYEGIVPGPTLAVCPGDKLIVNYENDLGDTPDSWQGGIAPQLPAKYDPGHDHAADSQPTNLHTHGFHVSPDGNSDNVFLDIPTGEDFRYEYDLPEDHPPGLLWYHPHRHGYSEPQVYAGMVGAIWMQGGLDEAPEIKDIPMRTMAITSLQLGDGAVVPVQESETPKSPYFINGELEPEIKIRPGQVQRWRIANMNDNAIVRVKIPGQMLYALANDGNTLTKVDPRESLLIGPGERREVLVQGGKAGTYELRSMPFAQFQDPDGPLPASKLATITSSGEPVDDKLPKGRLLPTTETEDLADADVDERHKIVYTEAEQPDGSFAFLINGKAFNPDRIDETMKLGEVNEWTIVNGSKEWHTFHIHVNDFQVIAYKSPKVPEVTTAGPEDVPTDDIDPEDTVKLSPGGSVTMRTRPTDYTGTFVFHCHMLFHEDRGMMGVVEVEQ